ncbi:MAG: SDR family oxidoreductase [Balneolaceae bacterium]|nr:MAG: SDR family oxidoreductase [Balneolaceae bacterium]
MTNTTFSNKIVIVTGGANGIGRAIVNQFAKRNAHVVIADVDKVSGKGLASEITAGGGKALFVETDVADPVSVRALFDEIGKKWGAIHCLINNAGISEFIRFDKLKPEEWDRILNTNLKAAFLCSQQALAYMKKAGGGSIIQIASTRALMSEPRSEAYAASKGGLLALTHAMAASLAEFNINVNAISPGWIHTGDYNKLREIDHKQHFSQRVGKPEDIARACMFLCNPENNFITGENLIIDGGMTRKMIYEG